MHDWYNEEARRIWSEHAEAGRSLPGMKLFPIQRPQFTPDADLVFVGMNPSFARESRRELHRRYAWNANAGAARIAALVEEEREARERYKIFYGRLAAFAEQAGAERVEYLDLLPVRHTSQAEVVAAFWNKNGEASEVCKACLQLFELTLQKLRPKTVVVANAEASRRVRQLLALSSEDGGRTHRWAALPATAFFLSGMLTGQRALDEFSFIRLLGDVRESLACY